MNENDTWLLEKRAILRRGRIVFAWQWLPLPRESAGVSSDGRSAAYDLTMMGPLQRALVIGLNGSLTLLTGIASAAGTPSQPIGDLIWTWIERVSALVAAVGIPYLVYERRQHLPQLRFQFSAGQRETFTRDALTFGRVTVEGSIQNGSLDPNTIERVYLVVWRTKRRRNTLRFGFGDIEILDAAGSPLGPPISFKPRESIAVHIKAEFPLTGTADAGLFPALKQLANHPGLALPMYSYELAFEDVMGNLFDADGLPRSRRLIDLLWTFDNAWQRFRDGQPGMLLHHILAIGWEELRFRSRRALRSIGL